MEMTPSFVGGVDLNSRVAALEAAFMEIWDRRVDDDRYNQLVATAGLAVEQAVVLRAYGRYLRQLGSTYSQGYIAQTLNRHAHIAAKLYALFETRFRLDLSPEQRDRQMSSLRKSIETALADVSSLEEDRVLRRYQSVVMATLRTNYFQRDAAGRRNPSLAFKLNPRLLDGIPLPKPYREIFVYGARVEGLHLRFGPVARGGLRWSDRPEDYRTEVLGLVKAQQVKNAVIVPFG
jgi:glutamate dehydrogenase